jgi:23S rRNA pseudouridine1911/1915/1917 synthase
MASTSRERHFVVASGPTDLCAIVELLAPGDTQALEQGRVFVNGKRAEPSLREVATGTRVTWVAARPRLSTDGEGFKILDHHGSLIVVVKPAAWSSEPDRSGHSMSLREHVADQLNVRDVHIVTRLDLGVSGLALVAVGERACRQSAELQDRGHIEKHYLAIAVGGMDKDVQWSQPVAGAQSALSLCHPLAHSPSVHFSGNLVTEASLLRIDARTGRHHQIRIHAASNGHPLLGDRRYGGPRHFVMRDGTVRPLSRPMLHAFQLNIHLPGLIWTTSCPAPADMHELWGDLGGDDFWPTS